MIHDFSVLAFVTGQNLAVFLNFFFCAFGK